MCECCQTPAASTPIDGRDFTVEGMTCGSCASKVEKVLTAVPGVTGVAVDVAAGRVTVAGLASGSAIADAVAAAGYRVSA